jgi:hypothetical protein
MTSEQHDELNLIMWLCTEIGLETFGRRGDELVQTSQIFNNNKTHEFVRDIRKRIEVMIANDSISR